MRSAKNAKTAKKKIFAYVPDTSESFLVHSKLFHRIYLNCVHMFKYTHLLCTSGQDFILLLFHSFVFCCPFKSEQIFHLQIITLNLHLHMNMEINSFEFKLTLKNLKAKNLLNNSDRINIKNYFKL